jgi:cytochrome c oxidase subunit 1
LAPYVPAEWNSRLFQVGVGGAILFVSGALLPHRHAHDRLEQGKGYRRSKCLLLKPCKIPPSPQIWLDRWAPWVYGTLALIVIVYGPQLFDMIKNIALTSPGFRVW